MTDTTIACPQCNQLLSVPPSAFGMSLPCPVCRWAIAIPGRDTPPPSDIILEQQGDILSDYHQRLIVLYERTTVLIEVVRARHAAAQVEIKEFVDGESQRVLDLVEAARIQLVAIVDAAEQAAPRVRFESRFPHKIRCPHCRKTLRYKNRGAGKSLQCPNPDCGRPIALPAFVEPFWQAIHLEPIQETSAERGTGTFCSQGIAKMSQSPTVLG